jgi:2-(1,2-epoxy-1,2-dihydrophenyl)acetyl-CoA isomerase
VTRTFGDVAVSVADDHLAMAEIRRPPDNFFDAELIGDLADAYGWLDEQAAARAILLCSQGKNFCAGADFSGRSGRARRVGDSGGALALYQEAARLFGAGLPVIAVVQGAAVGGGLGLACSADFRVASPESRFSANFARLGLHQGFGLSVTLPDIVGQQAAMDMLYTGRRVKGEEALRIGLADRLAPDAASLRTVATDLATQIAESAPLAVRAIRATLRAGRADRARRAMDGELAEQGRLWQTADFSEGVRAAAERRQPKFEGR